MGAEAGLVGVGLRLILFRGKDKLVMDSHSVPSSENCVRISPLSKLCKTAAAAVPSTADLA